jgi:predicted membrane protein
MRKTAARFERALVGGIAGFMIGSSSAFTLALLVAAVTHLFGREVFLFGRDGVVAGAIIGAIAGTAFRWRASTEQS